VCQQAPEGRCLATQQFMAKAGPINIPWRADFAVGWGIDGFSGLPAVKPWAFDESARVQFNKPVSPTVAAPGNIHFQQGVVSSAEHYERTVKAAAALNVKGWGAALQTSTDFLSSMEMSDKVVHYVVTSRFETTSLNVVTQQSVMPVLSLFAAELLAREGPSKWSEHFGSHFVAGYVLGGLLVGKASFSCRNTGDAQALTAGLEAKVGFFGSGGVSGSLERQAARVRPAGMLSVCWVTTYAQQGQITFGWCAGTS